MLGGFAEVSADGLTVLADLATRSRTSTARCCDRMIGEMEEHIEKTEPGSELDRLITRLDHFKQVDQHLTGTAMH